jgi:glycosyltransferase involved in cell wall biosynthesis
MNCLHICNDLLGSKVHQKLYERLIGHGVDQTVFYPSRSNTWDRAKDFQNQAPYKVVTSPPLKKYHRVLFRSKINFLSRSLVRQVNMKTIDIMHATTLFSDGAIAYKLHKQYNIPYVVSIRATDISVFLKYRPDLFKKGLNILNNAKSIVFISNSLENNFFAHPKLQIHKKDLIKKCRMVYNGVDDFWLGNTAEKKEVVPSKIIYIGSLINRKNPINLAKAVIGLSQENPNRNYTLTIIGDGPLKDMVKNLASVHPNIISYTDSIHNLNRLKEVLMDHHIFAMPSKGETFGLVYIEALSQGLPIIACENEGVHGIFSYPVGTFSPDASLHNIRESLVETINNYKNFNLELIDFTEFDWSNVSNKYVELYQYAVADHSPVFNKKIISGANGPSKKKISV